MVTIKNKILATLRQNPNSTTVELYALLPDLIQQTISSSIHSLRSTGEAVVTSYKVVQVGENGRKQKSNAYSAVVRSLWDDTSKDGLRVEKQLEKQLELKLLPEVKGNVIKAGGSVYPFERVAELEAWKENAIERYPLLGTSVVLLEARRLVAEEARSEGCLTISEEVLAGKRDQSLAVRVLVKALGDTK